jgi:predicted anti-sigma-YlaC factor YlaD
MQIREAISARLDREDSGLDEATVYGHLAQCPGCRAFSHDAENLHRAVRLSPAPEIRDLTPAIQRAIGNDTHTQDSGTQGVLRWVVVAIAAAQIAIAVPALVFGAGAGNTGALGEVQHVTDFVGLAVMWLLSRPLTRPAHPVRAARLA